MQFLTEIVDILYINTFQVCHPKVGQAYLFVTGMKSYLNTAIVLFIANQALFFGKVVESR